MVLLLSIIRADFKFIFSVKTDNMTTFYRWILTLLLFNPFLSFGISSAIDSFPETLNRAELNKILRTKFPDEQIATIKDVSSNFILATTAQKPGFVVFKKQKKSAELIWRFSKPEFGDLIFNKISLLDFNNDNFSDIIICVGDEASFYTYIFIYNQGQFEQAYSKYAKYPTIVDLDANGKPELLVNTYSNLEKEIPFWYQGFDKHKDELNAIYSKIVSKNKNWSYHPDYPWEALHICFPIQIMEMENGQFIDTTKRYPKHLKERIQFLNKIKTKLPPTELEGCNQVIEQLQQYLN